MTPEVFNRIVWDGNRGIGHCQHRISEIRGEIYEVWDLMFRHLWYGDQVHIVTTHTNSTNASFDALVVGDAIEGV